MNTLHELRATLDHHAHDVADDPSYARVAAVRGRARRVRQQRAGGVLAAAVLAVAGIVLVPSLGDRGPQPLAAPDTMTALGWTYDWEASETSRSDRVTVDVAASELPRLVSWSTRGRDQQVLVRTGDGQPWASDAADFGDHVWLPPRFEGEVSVEGPEGITVSTYRLDDARPPAGIGEGALTFRDDVAGRELLDAALGEVGEDSVEITVPATRAMVWLADLCQGIPRDAVVRVDFRPRGGSSSGGCDNAPGFDPGGRAGTGYRGTGERQTLRMTVWRDGRRLTSEELGGARLGLGAYAVTEPSLRLAGRDFESPIEYGGHVWEAVDQVAAVGDDLPALRVPEGGMHLVQDSLRSRGFSFAGLEVDGRVDSFNQSRIGSSGGTTRPVRPGQEVSIRVGRRTEVRDSALVLYRLRD